MRDVRRDAESPIAVIGGGLAGIAAALALSDAGRAVTLFERRPFLGGRAYSFRDPDSGAVVDNGQHVLVGACDRLRAFLGRIRSPAGAFVRQRRLSLPLLDGRGRLHELRAAPLPPPFHLLAALLAHRPLGPRARLSVARDVAALARTDAAERRSLDPVSLGAWLEERGTPREAVAGFWEPLVRPALNIEAAAANVPLTAMVIERGLWRGSSAGALWLPAVGLSRALGEPALEALLAAGVELRTGAPVDGIVFADGRAAAVEAGGERNEASGVVAAVPPRELDRIVPASLRPEGGWEVVGASPIVNVYLWYDRPVSPPRFAGVLDSSLQWIFDRTALLGEEAAGGHCLGISLSAADEAVTLPKEELAERCDAAVARLLPGRVGARRLRWVVVKEPRATFRAGPGIAHRRPGTRGPASGLYLAGDWTDTGWPATMEGAVRSGEAAATTLLQDRTEGR